MECIFRTILKVRAGGGALMFCRCFKRERERRAKFTHSHANSSSRKKERKKEKGSCFRHFTDAALDVICTFDSVHLQCESKNTVWPRFSSSRSVTLSEFLRLSAGWKSDIQHEVQKSKIVAAVRQRVESTLAAKPAQEGLFVLVVT